tara:strand:+ start:114 stop:446 length:333 start_codon:yes stop_codon:yes gene_type:complete
MHRLVAEAFALPRLHGQNEVNHIDRNRVENLEWASRQENVRHSVRTNPNRGNAGAQLSQAVEALGVKKKTGSGLSKSSLVMTKGGRIVSKKKHEKRQYKKYGHILRQYQF